MIGKKYLSKKEIQTKRLRLSGHFFCNSFGFNFFRRIVIVDLEHLRKVVYETDELLGKGNRMNIHWDKFESGERQRRVISYGIPSMIFDFESVYDNQGDMKVRITYRPFA